LISNLLQLRQPAQLRLDRPIHHCESTIAAGHLWIGRLSSASRRRAAPERSPRSASIGAGGWRCDNYRLDDLGAPHGSRQGSGGV